MHQLRDERNVLGTQSPFRGSPIEIVRPQEELAWRDINGSRYIWTVASLWEQARDLPIELVNIDSLNALDSVWWFEQAPSLRELLKHFHRILFAELGHPLLIMRDGWVLDGGHRIVKALIQGMDVVPVCRFESLPLDFIRVQVEFPDND